ncbi:MAG: hypothetical protein COA67_05265 [Lutibacter sp.]|nr:MAG: hypothetical protein COA67_05265 [Lutibacter sp.]
MNKTFLHKIISIWTVVLLLCPIGVQFFHSLENHEHFVCSSEETTHLHSQQIDCSFCHVLLETTTVFNNNHFTLHKTTITDNAPVFFEKENIEIHLLYKSSRGPPIFIA